MDNESIRIRIARPEDARALLEIYAPYVENTAISFEYKTPSTEEFCGRIVRTLKKYPYLLAEQKGKILGYAYASVFHEREAYSWSVETSIYVDSSLRRTGVGRRLHEALENVLREQHVLNMNACIAYPSQEDEYLTKNSVYFHAHMGYRLVGEFYQSGYKFGRWYNMVWMEKHIGEHAASPAAFVPFPLVRERLGEKYDIDII